MQGKNKSIKEMNIKGSTKARKDALEGLRLSLGQIPAKKGKRNGGK
jgi:hypothetical protein